MITLVPNPQRFACGGNIEINVNIGVLQQCVEHTVIPDTQRDTRSSGQ